MAANPDQLCPKSFTEWAATEPLALIVGMVTVPVLAIALGIGITILTNALR
jgi:hypothetical protein